MPYLGDYLGHLLSEITIARVQADLEAVRVAELYASHPLLRHVPVPHFRLPTMTLDVPIVIKAMEEAKAGESPRGEVTLPTLRERFAGLLDLHLKRAKISLSRTEKSNLDQALNQTIENHTKAPYVSISAIHVADELVATTMKSLGDPKRARNSPESLKFERLSDDLKAASRQEFINLRSSPPRLSVAVTTAELREAGEKELLAQLHLSISEEAFEWTVVENQGTSNPRLIPE